MAENLMSLFSSTQPSLRARVLPRFPARVIAGSGMTITKNGNVYTFAATANDIPLSALADQGTDTLVGRDAAGSGPPTAIAVGSGLQMNGLNTLQMTIAQRTRIFTVASFTPGAALATNQTTDIFVPFACTITRWTMLVNPSGSIVVDVWRAPYASFPPAVGNSITGGNPPTVSSAVKNQDSTLTGWTTAINSSDTLRFNINSITTVTRVSLNLEVAVT